MAESRPPEGSSGASVAGETSTPQKSSDSLIATYRNTAARLLAVHADVVPLDVTSLVNTPADGRIRLEVTPLGRAVLDFAAIRTEGVVGGDEHTIQQRYDDAGNVIPGGFDQTERPLEDEEVARRLGEITDRVMEMTLDVPEGVIREVEQALIAAEVQRQASQTPLV